MNVTAVGHKKSFFSLILKRKNLKHNFLVLNFFKSTAFSLICNYAKLTLSSKSLLNAKLLEQVNFVSKVSYTELELIGLGYRFSIKKRVIRLNLGYSHIIFVQIPKFVFFVKRKNRIVFYSLFKLRLSNLIAQLLHFKKLNSYKLKGLKRRLDIFKAKPGKRTK